MAIDKCERDNQRDEDASSELGDDEILRQIALLDLSGVLDQESPELRATIDRIMASPEWPKMIDDDRYESIKRRVFDRIRGN